MSTQTPCHNILQTRPFDRISGCTPVPSGGSSTAARREYRSYPTLNPSLGEGLHGKPDSLPTHRQRNPAGKTGYFGTLQTRPFDRISGCIPVPSGGSYTAARRDYRSYPTLNPSLGEGLHGKPNSLPTYRQRNPAGKTIEVIFFETQRIVRRKNSRQCIRSTYNQQIGYDRLVARKRLSQSR